jgi:DNA-directed RNA polymerase specialized sigma subunit
MAKRVTQKYVTNKELLPEIIAFKKTWSEEDKKGEPSEELGRMILLIATRYADKGNFTNYTWKDDMIGDAVLTCLKYIKNFNPEKSQNPFAYITTICRNAFINHIKKQHRHSEIKDVCYNSHEILYDGPVYLCKAINYQKLIEE